MIEAIIFDFDGVIVDSNPIKRNAYFKIFSHVEGSLESIEEAIKENPKKTRYGIVEAILIKLKERNLIEVDDLDVEKDKYVQKYGETTEEETIKVKEIKGAKKALTNLSEKYSLFILTSTIQENIERIVEARRLNKYFKGVYGANSSDYNKPQILERMAEKHGFNPKKSVFVGDGKADYECALHYNMPFVAILNETNDFSDREDIKWKLNDLGGLPDVIGKIEKNYITSL